MNLVRPARPAVPVSGVLLAMGMLALALMAALLAGWAPITFSIVIVFLFAGPHNWLEARYFLTRLPARWGKLTPFFALAFAGMFGLTAGAIALPWLGDWLRLDDAGWHTALATWNTLLIAWIVILIQMRMRQNPRRDWAWTLPVAFVILAVNWLAPRGIGMALVYLHPLMALWLLDRELRRTRPEWRPAYHGCLLAIPLLLGALYLKLHNAPPLLCDEELCGAITQHAGDGIFTGISNHFLVAAHTFLEMVHYGVWIVAIPLIGLRTAPWRLENVPMARRSRVWRWGVIMLLLVGAAIALALWLGFRADYATTRHLYFQIALVHVLAEVPFLLRAL